MSEPPPSDPPDSGLPGLLPESAVPAGIHRDFFRLWLGKRAGRAMPARADFDPSEMPHLLPHIMLLDVERDPLRIRVRLVGTAIVDAIGMDLTGRYVDEIENAEEPLRRHLRMAEDAQPYFLEKIPIPWSPRDYKTYAVLAVPLARDGRTVDMIMSLLSFTRQRR